MSEFGTPFSGLTKDRKVELLRQISYSIREKRLSGVAEQGNTML